MNRHDAQILARKQAKEHGHIIGRITQSGNSGSNYYGDCKICRKIAGCKWTPEYHGWIPYGKATIEDCKRNEQ